MTWWAVLLPLAALVAGGGGRDGEGEGLTRRHTIEIRAMAFHPDTLTIQPGDTVVWINHDIVPHTATSAGKWDTGTLTQRATGRYVAGRSGRLTYVCTLHPTMRGTLIVKEAL